MLSGHSRSSSLDSAQSDSYSELLNDLTDVRLAVIKISNIAWDLTSSDVIECLECVHTTKRHVHIPIDRATGKTKADMFVELPSMVEAIKCMAKYNKRILKGRAVTVTLSSLEELIHAHFPEATPRSSEFIAQTEAISLVAICKNYKAHFSRKCAERPFEHVISILRLAPWHQMDHTMCERLFFIVFEAVESLVEHLTRSHLTAIYKVEGTCPTTPTMLPSSQLSSELLTRLLTASRAFPAFTEHQKMDIQRTADRMNTPRFGSPIILTVEPKLPRKHLRSSSIDRILAELGGETKRSDAVNKLMRNAFDRIMLSDENSSPTKHQP